MSAVPPSPEPDSPAAEDPDAILARARERGRAAGAPYAGIVTPREAHRLHTKGAAVIVDVRTAPEREFVGQFPDAATLEWRRYGEATPDAEFTRKLATSFSKDHALLFLCRSAVRSHHAAEAATREGFTAAFNILEGFEGELGPDGHRGRTGWRAAGLPWRQG